MEARRVVDMAAEALILGTVCLSPWAFGAVEAWAELYLYMAVALLAQVIDAPSSVAAPVLWLAGVAARTVIALGRLFSTMPGASMTLSSAPEVALGVSYLGIVFACLWQGRLRWIGVPMSAAVALWPRPAPPVAWLAADGDDAAVVLGGQEITMKPGARQYATGVWAQRRGFSQPSDAAAAREGAFDCDRKGCLPVGPARPALAASWTRREPSADRWAAMCAAADIVILRSDTAPPGRRAMASTRSARSVEGSNGTVLPSGPTADIMNTRSRSAPIAIRRGMIVSSAVSSPLQISTLPGSATKARRMRLPSSVRTGMFCRLGSVDDSRPVLAIAIA